ncbi:hypothetical protein ACO1PK_15615 [Alishewanella sp. d11]|uniref:hypothetical protein n=1 Tax=Alishewanella sp. d11 TaxID=3414030 RepID=UPI003BF8AA10
MREGIFSEFLCAVLLGSIPALIILNDGGVDGLLEFADSITPYAQVFYYFFSVAIFHFIFVFLANRQSEATKFPAASTNVVIDVLKRVGFTFLGVYRTIAGCIFVLVTPIVFIEQSIFSVSLLVIAYVFSFGCVIMCAAVENENSKL